MDDADRTPVDYSEELSGTALPKRLAVAIPDSVSYSGYAAANADAGFEDSGNAVGHTCAYLFSYREPDIRPTYEYFQSAAEEVRNLKLTQDEVND